MSNEESASWPREYAAAALLLLKAWHFADKEGRAAWDFAVELDDLVGLGLSRADLRRLICRGLLEHAEELAGGAESDRVFQSTGRLQLSQRSCFILTAAGRDAAIHLTCEGLSHARDAEVGGGTEPLPHRNSTASEACAERGPATKPDWNQDRRELTFRGLIVKSYLVPSPNQEHILNAFQEEGWPEFIHDPLPPAGEMEPHRRLQATIKSLNRRQTNNLIRFRGNGGDRVFWEEVGQ